MFGWEFPPYSSGGLGVACKGLTQALAEEGVEVTFVLPRRVPVEVPWCKVVFADNRPALEIDHSLQEKLHSGYLNEEEYRSLKERYPELSSLQSSLLGEVIQYGALAARVALEEEHDLIHAHDWLSVLAGMEAKRVSGKPLVVHIHATEFDRTALQGGSSDVYAIERVGMQYADKVIAVSHYTKQILVNRYGIDPNKIEVVHNGMDFADANVYQGWEEVTHELKKQGHKIVLFVGRLTIQKGVDYFLKAAVEVLKHEPKTIFLVSGVGDMERQLIQEAAYYGISDKVFFVGFSRGDAAASFYQLADVFVMPSVSEPFGIVPLEAIANNTPVIVSRQSGVAEVLKNALKVDFWDTEETAYKIIALLRHEALRETLIENGMKEAFGIVWKKAAEKCVLIYNRVTKALSS